MDFFEQQEVARRRTTRLVFYFVLAMIAIVVAIYFVVWIALVFSSGGKPNPYEETPWHPELFLPVALGTMGVILLGSLYKTAQLSAGGEAVAAMMGGRRIDRQTRDPAEQRLLNIVEEMALASGTPVPPVYVMTGEPSINAFAAGFEPGDAVIGVSQGCLTYLSRDELQGVMAHEFSHILNGDMRMNLRLVGILHGILILAILGWCVLRMAGTGRRSSRGGKDGGGMALILAVGLGLLVIGGIGLLFGKLIKSAISRQREYLADASAVQFTRLPGGIAGALKKIGGRPETSKIEDGHAEEISHMFFGNAFGSFGWHLFSTHPALAERIQRIDPSFSGEFPKRVNPVKVPAERRKADKKKKKRRETSKAAGAGGPLDAIPLGPADVLGQIGVAGMGQLLSIAALLESIPEPLRDASAEPYSARAVVYAVLLDRDAPMREKQLGALKSRAEELSYRETLRLAPLMDALPESSRLPLVETCVPTLKNLSPRQYATFRDNVAALVAADSKIDLLEYGVQTMLLGQLDVHFGLAKPVRVRYHRIDPLLPSLVGILSTLAYAGQEDEPDVKRAFDKGMAEVDRTASLAARSDCSGRSLDALEILAQAAPELKKRVLCACVACVAADGKVTTREGELVQVIAASLGVPVPPIVVTAPVEVPAQVTRERASPRPPVD